MKKLFICILFILTFNHTHAQIRLSKIDTVTTTYCRIKLGSDAVITPMTKLYPMVDFGFKSANKSKIPDPFLTIVDDEDKKIYVSGYIEVLNLFQQKGWTLLQSTLLTGGNVELLLKRTLPN